MEGKTKMNEEKNTSQNEVRRGILSNTPSRNKRVIALILTVTLIVIIGAVSYAYLPKLDLANEPENSLASTATLKLKYTDCASTNIEDCANISADLYPGDSITKTFEVENTGTKDIKYTIFFRELENTFKNGDLVYTLENMNTGNVLISNRPVPEGSLTNTLIKSGEVVTVENKNQYKLTITFLNRDYEQSDNYGATFSLKLKIDEAKMVPDGTMMARVDNEKLWAHKNEIKTIVFENTKNVKSDAAYIYDLSDGTTTPESVMAYLVPDVSDSTKYTAYIQGKGGVRAPENSARLFQEFSNLENIEGLKNFETSLVTTMKYMFYKCSKLSSLDLSSFNTSNVTDMVYMFGNCGSLMSLDFSNFDTSKVNDMAFMFYMCGQLTTLDLNNFDTRKVTSMERMFAFCGALTSLDINNFNTSKVTNMVSMFFSCGKLTTLDLRNFDTSKVTNMSSMFYGCGSLTTTFTIRGTECTTYDMMFGLSSSQNGAQITLNYTADASDLVDQMIATKSEASQVVKGSIVS